MIACDKYLDPNDDGSQSELAVGLPSSVLSNGLHENYKSLSCKFCHFIY